MSVNTAVLVIFFNRPDRLTRVLEQVSKAKPSKLYLFQDGPRNDNDLANINLCREVVDKFNWECDVYKNYREENLGCGQGPYTAISWVFENEEQAIILEDDCVPALSFFGYCDTLLEKYKDDKRVGMITGLNHFTNWDCEKDSYFFAKTGANWGWATWKRVWNGYDYHLKFLDNPVVLKKLKGNFLSKRIEKHVVSHLLHTKQLLSDGQKISYWDLQLEADKYLQNWLTIVPAKNMICNIGIGETSTHNAVESIFNNLKTFEIEEIVHPDCVIQDVSYDKKYYSITCPNIFVKIRNKLRTMIK